MLPGLELAACTNLAVPHQVMHHVARVESSFNPYAIGVVGGRLVRQPKSLGEAVSTAQMLEEKGYNFSLGISQVNRYNLSKYGLDSYEKAFQVCPNVSAGSRILAECYGRANSDWGKAFSCYYSGNFVTGYKHGYVQKIYASIAGAPVSTAGAAIPLAGQSDAPKRVMPIPSRSGYGIGVEDIASTLAARRGGLNTSMLTSQPPLAPASIPTSPQVSVNGGAAVLDQRPVPAQRDAPVILGASSAPAVVPAVPAASKSPPVIASEPYDAALVF